MKIAILLIAGLFAGAVSGAVAPKAAGSPAKSAALSVTNSVATNAAPAIPQSVFVVPQSPRDGRNPFFPNSRYGLQAPKPKEVSNTVVFVLNGITSPPRRTAMINGRTFEPGESGEIRLPSGGKVMISCAEIRDHSAVIIVSGERRELWLRAGI